MVAEYLLIKNNYSERTRFQILENQAQLLFCCTFPKKWKFSILSELDIIQLTNSTILYAVCLTCSLIVSCYITENYEFTTDGF